MPTKPITKPMNDAKYAIKFSGIVGSTMRSTITNGRMNPMTSKINHSTIRFAGPSEIIFIADQMSLRFLRILANNCSRLEVDLRSNI